MSVTVEATDSSAPTRDAADGGQGEPAEGAEEGAGQGFEQQAGERPDGDDGQRGDEHAGHRGQERPDEPVQTGDPVAVDAADVGAGGALGGGPHGQAQAGQAQEGGQGRAQDGGHDQQQDLLVGDAQVADVDRAAGGEALGDLGLEAEQLEHEALRDGQDGHRGHHLGGRRGAGDAPHDDPLDDQPVGGADGHGEEGGQHRRPVLLAVAHE